MYLMRTGDMRNILVTERDEMLDRFFDADGVVENDVAHFLADDPEIVEDDARLLSFGLGDERFIKFSCHQDYARYLHLDQPLNKFNRKVYIIVRVQKNEVITTRKHGRLNALNDLGKERIRNI